MTNCGRKAPNSGPGGTRCKAIAAHAVSRELDPVEPRDSSRNPASALCFVMTKDIDANASGFLPESLKAIAAGEAAYTCPVGLDGAGVLLNDAEPAASG